MEAFYEKYSAKLNKKSDIGGPNGDCKIWNGSKDAGYGVLWVVWPGHTRKRVKVHRLALIIDQKISKNDIPDHRGPNGIEASHLCGVKCCVNPHHLCWESHRKNQARMTCRKNEDCLGCDPPCII